MSLEARGTGEICSMKVLGETVTGTSETLSRSDVDESGCEGEISLREVSFLSCWFVTCSHGHWNPHSVHFHPLAQGNL